MSRFVWLEMDEAKGSAPAGGPKGSEDLDETVCLQRADGLLREGYYETALQWYSRALRFAQELEAAWAGQVRCLIGLEEFPEAEVWAKRGLERFPNSPDLLAARAVVLLNTSGLSRAMEYSDAALQVRGQDVGSYPWIARGEILLSGGGSRPSADRCFAKALELAGTDWYTHFLIGLALFRRGFLEEARLRLQAGTSLERRSSSLWCTLGDCHERLGEEGAAIIAYHRALEANARCKYAKMRLARLERMGPITRLIYRIRGRRDKDR
jgi:tetratricopeptide (TPR) repeat protein